MAKEEYKSRLAGYMNGAATCFAMSVARDTGLLSVFTQPHEPMNLTEIATKANLKQRYVKEVLGSLVVARVIEIDDASEAYYVPDELRNTLNVLSVSADLMNYAICRKEDLKTCLDPNGPNGYSGQPIKGYGKALNARQLVHIDTLINEEFFTSTPDLKDKLEEGIDVVEYGCGEGVVIIEMATRFPKSRFVASDYSHEAIAVASEVIKSKNLQNITVKQADLNNLPLDMIGKFDLASARDTVHDMGNPVKGCSEMINSLKDGGVLNIIEVILQGNNHKENREDNLAPLLFLYSSAICVPESLSQPGGVGLGCTSGMRGIKGLLLKSGIPENKLEIYPLAYVPFMTRFVYRKK